MVNKEDLNSEEWKRKRREIIQRDHFTCCACGDFGKTLNVHHLSYDKDREYWDYTNSNFVTLCSDCHRKLHNLKNGNLRKTIEELRIIASKIEPNVYPQKINIEIKNGDKYPLIFINGFLFKSYSYAYYLSRTKQLLKGKIVIHYIKGFREIVFGKRSKMTSLKNELSKLISFGIVDDFSYSRFYLKDIIQGEILWKYNSLFSIRKTEGLK